MQQLPVPATGHDAVESLPPYDLCRVAGLVDNGKSAAVWPPVSKIAQLTVTTVESQWLPRCLRELFVAESMELVERPGVRRLVERMSNKALYGDG